MEIVNFTADTLEQEVFTEKKDVLVDFWASWCAPCKMQSPIIDELKSEDTGFIIGKVDVETERDLAVRFRVMSVPTIMIFRNGQEHRRVSGLQSKQDLLDMLK